MSKIVKKPHKILVAGVSCVDGTYKLNVSGRLAPLQLFQCVVPGHTEFHFVKLPGVMSKRDAVEYMIGQPIGQPPGIREFLMETLRKYDAVLNKVPGKRGRPRKNPEAVKESKKVAKKAIQAIIEPVAVPKPVKKVIQATIEPIATPKPVKQPVVSGIEKARIMEANREKLRQVSAKMKAIRLA